MTLSEGIPFCDNGGTQLSIATPCGTGKEGDSTPSSQTNKKRELVSDDNISTAINSANSALQIILMKMGSNIKPQQQGSPFLHLFVLCFSLIPIPQRLIPALIPVPSDSDSDSDSSVAQKF